MGCQVLNDEISIAEGATFVVSDNVGNIIPSNGHGFFKSDTRFLSAFVVTLNGVLPRPLSSGSTVHHTAKFYSTNGEMKDVEAGCLVLLRERHVNAHLSESLRLTNHGQVPATIDLAVELQADFADIFEIHASSIAAPRSRTRAGSRDYALRFDFRDAGLRWTTLVKSSVQPRHDDTLLHYDVTLEPQQSWSAQLDIEPFLTERLSQSEAAELENPHAARPVALPEPASSTLETRFTPMARSYERSLVDLQALRVVLPSGHIVPAAGLPWFMAVFGRDSLISGIQTLAVDPSLARGALRALAEYQAKVDDPFRDAEPGKIPHEIRHGRLSHHGKVPHSRYFGTVDATPLFLHTLAETVRWTGDLDLARELLPAAELALRWIDQSGDLDGDGFVEYQRRSRQGLQNQGWKDSHDAVNFANGEAVEGPIALCEVQGYVYQAKRSMAWLFRQLGDADRSSRLTDEAARLKRQFNERFWLPDQEIIALALDGKKRPVDAVASNMGHCLWSGIVDRDKAEHVAQRLMAADMYSGWGVRTLSTNMARYNPISYHNGSVWPHDNAIIAAGLAAYGFKNEASRVIRGLFDAVELFPLYRLPELFAGVPRLDGDFPVKYPQANAPQAWAAGAIVMMTQIWLGLTHSSSGLRTRPLPGAPATSWRNLPFQGRLISVSTSGRPQISPALEIAS
jgi:glycogen debranching enzyme